MGYLEDARQLAAIEGAQQAARKVVEFEQKLARAEADPKLADHVARFQNDLAIAEAELAEHEASLPTEDDATAKAAKNLAETAEQIAAEMRILEAAAELSNDKKATAENVLAKDPGSVLAVTAQVLEG